MLLSEQEEVKRNTFTKSLDSYVSENQPLEVFQTRSSEKINSNRLPRIDFQWTNEARKVLGIKLLGEILAGDQYYRSARMQDLIMLN